MSEDRRANPAASTSAGPGLEAVPGLDSLADAAWVLRPPAQHEKKAVLRPEAAHLVDSLLTRVARGRGALQVAIGEGLAALSEGDRALQLGYSSIGDYARERLGMAPRTAQDAARLARELRARPLLREAVRRGEVSARKAQTVLPVARGEAEEPWVARARADTVRALEAAVRDAVTTAEPDDEEWELVCVPLASDARARLDEAMALAGKLLGATAPQWQRLEAFCQEYLGAHPVEAPDGGAGSGGPLHWPVRSPGGTETWLEPVMAVFEEESRRWAYLATVDPVESPAIVAVGRRVDPGQLDPRLLDGELRRLAAMRDRWDELLGHLGMLLLMLGLWRDMKFVSFSHYCAERLGMSARTIEQRAWLERRLYSLPDLRDAMRAGRVSYEKARLVAGCADDASVKGWIELAERSTCIALRREIEARDERQMRARGELDVRTPRRIAALLTLAFRAAREVAGHWLSPGECLGRIAEHFVSTWREPLAERNTPQKKVLARDGGLCQVPGCSRAAMHAHHVVYRSRGGGDELQNLTAVCAAHHLHCLHQGWIRVRGEAPGGLAWGLGVRPGTGWAMEPLAP